MTLLSDLIIVKEDVVTSSAAITDHAIIRGDGGTKGVQESAVTIDDSGNMNLGGSSITNLASAGADGLPDIGVCFPKRGGD